MESDRGSQISRSEALSQVSPVVDLKAEAKVLAEKLDKYEKERKEEEKKASDAPVTKVEYPTLPEDMPKKQNTMIESKKRKIDQLVGTYLSSKQLAKI